jgi:hypothetical protein
MKAESVFIKVPFDRQYTKLFRALVFALHDCGFFARCALEGDDGSETRLTKLYDIIRDCPLGIHDLSRTSLDRTYRLPRFNMPLELGLFLGAKRYGGSAHRGKSCLILDRKPYRYQIFCSDIAGQDIRAHENNIENAIRVVRNWLQAARPAKSLPHAAMIARHYLQFRADLPAMCTSRGSSLQDLTFIDTRVFVQGWLAENIPTARA